MSVSRPAATATKAQILDAFDELASLSDTLEKQVKSLEKAVREASKAASAPALPQPAPQPIAPTLPIVRVELAPPESLDNMEGVLRLLETLQGGFGKTLSDLTEKLSVQAGKLEDLRSNLEIQRAELSTLYTLDVDEDSLDTLLAEYASFEKSSRETFMARREALETALLDARLTWEREAEEHDRTVRERQAEAALTEGREAEEYGYALDQARKLGAENDRAAQAALAAGLKDARETQEKAWAEKEKAVSELERAQAEAQARVEAFPAEKDAATKRADGEGRGIGTGQARVRADLAAKDLEGRRRIFEQRIAGLQTSLSSQQARIAALSTQLDAASRQMQDLAVKAIEGASGASSLQAFKELAMEQAKAQGKPNR
jgi:hypothetical protein